MKFGFSYFKYHLRKAAYYILFVGISTLIFLLMNAFVSNINKESVETLRDLSGEHHSVVWRSNRNKKFELDEDPDVIITGEFINAGNYEVDNTDCSISIGYLSNEALELGHIKLVEGNFPIEDSEIVLENHLRYIGESELKIGDSVVLDIDGNINIFKITGFIEDYKAYWNLEDGYTEGITDFPSGLISKNLAEQMQTSYNFLVFQNNIEIDEDYSLMAMELLTRHDITHFTFNDATHWRNYNIISTPVRLYRMIFLVALFFVSVIISYYMDKDYLSSYLSQNIIIEYLGGSVKYRILQILFLSLIPFTVGCICSVLIYVLGVLCNFIPHTLSLFIVILIILLSTAIFAIQIGFIILGLFRKKKENIKVSSINQSNFFVKFSILSIKRNIVKVLTVILLIAFMCSVIVCIDFDNRTRAYMLIPDRDYFNAVANEGELCIWLGDFTATSYSTKYNSNQMKYLDSVLDCNIEYFYNSSVCMILPQTDDLYWNTIKERRLTKKLIGTESYISPKDIPSMPDDVIATDEINLIVMKEDDIASFKETYTGLDVDRIFQNGSAVMFVPPIKKEGYDFQSNDENRGLITQEHYSNGMSVRFGAVNPGDSIYNVFTDKSKIQYSEIEFTLSEVLGEECKIRDTVIDNCPVILISEETVIGNELLDQISQFRITFANDISESEYTAIHREFNKVAMSTKNSVITESRFYTRFFTRFYMTINSMMIIISLLTLIVIIICLMQIISSYLYEHKRQYGILKVLGTSKRFFTLMIFIEDLFYWIVSIITVLPLTLWILSSFAVNKFGIYLICDDVYRCLVITAIPLVLLLVVICIIGRIFKSKLNRMSIDDLIRIGE